MLAPFQAVPYSMAGEWIIASRAHELVEGRKQAEVGFVASLRPLISELSTECDGSGGFEIPANQTALLYGATVPPYQPSEPPHAGTALVPALLTRPPAQ